MHIGIMELIIIAAVLLACIGLVAAAVVGVVLLTRRK